MHGYGFFARTVSAICSACTSPRAKTRNANSPPETLQPLTVGSFILIFVLFDKCVGSFIPTPMLLAGQMHAADPAIQRLLVEPIRVATEHAPSEYGYIVAVLEVVAEGIEFAEQWRGLRAQIRDNPVTGGDTHERRFFPRLRAPENLFGRSGALGGGFQHVFLRAREPAFQRGILFA